jgi:hypothetical protein
MASSFSRRYRTSDESISISMPVNLPASSGGEQQADESTPAPAADAEAAPAEAEAPAAEAST